MCRIYDELEDEAYGEELYNNGKQAGWQECLRSVRASVREYPKAGGDVELMREIDKLCERSWHRGRTESIHEMRSKLKELEDKC